MQSLEILNLSKKMTEYQVYSLNKSTQNEGRKTNYPKKEQ